MDIRRFLHLELKNAGFQRRGAVAYKVENDFTGVFHIEKSRNGADFLVHCGIIADIENYRSAAIGNFLLYNQINQYGVPDQAALMNALNPKKEMPDGVREKVLSESMHVVVREMTEKWMDIGWVREFMREPDPSFIIMKSLVERLEGGE